MNSRPPETSSPSNFQKSISSNAPPEHKQLKLSSAIAQDPTETPQAPTGPSISTPVIVITGSPSPRPSPPETTRDSRPLHQRHTSEQSTFSQPLLPQDFSTSSERPRSQSQPPRDSTPLNTVMSSASSSPGSTSTAGSASGSNPSYQLPYAPFPYPMPANTRRSGQQQGGQGK